MVVIGEKHLEFAKPQAAQIAPDAQFVVEPMGRNTAPAIALAALALDETERECWSAQAIITSWKRRLSRMRPKLPANWPATTGSSLLE